MKKLLFSAPLCLALLSGCSDNAAVDSGTVNTNHAKVSVSSLRDTVTTEIDEILASDYPNFTFSDAFSIIVPDADTISHFQLQGKENVCTDEELIAYASDALATYFSDLYTEEEREALLAEADIQAYSLFLENGEMGLTVYRNGGIHALNRGVALGIDPMAGPANIYFPIQNHDVLQTYTGDTLSCDDTYALTDGDCTVADAVNLAQTMLNELSGDAELTSEVYEASAIQLTDDITVFQMSIRRCFDNVPFDVVNSSDGSFSFQALENNEDTEKSYSFMSGSMVISQKDWVDFWINVDQKATIAVQDASETCLSPKSALEIGSAYLTGNVQFEVQSLSLVYAPYILEADSAAQEQVDPVWKIHMYNANDDRQYVLYVDAVTGNCENAGYSYTEET